MAERARALAVAILAATLVAGCAAAAVEGGAEPERDRDPLPERERPEEVLDRGLAALAGGDFAAARVDLLRVYSQCWSRAEGRQALLALAAAELDPRNPRRSPTVAATLAGDYLRLERAPDWTRPVAIALYLSALDASPPVRDTVRRAPADAQPPRAAGQAPPASATPAPAPAPATAPAAAATAAVGGELTGCDPVEVEAEDTMRAVLPGLPGPGMAARLVRLEVQRDSLTARVTQLEQQLAALQEELARIRKTLKP